MPQVASFGFTEAEARERGADVVVGKFPMGGVGAATVYGDRKGMVKIVGDARYGELLGAHIVGARATEMIAELVVAEAAGGRLRGGRPHDPPAPDLLRGGHGRRPRDRRVGDPRMRP